MPILPHGQAAGWLLPQVNGRHGLFLNLYGLHPAVPIPVGQFGASVCGYPAHVDGKVSIGKMDDAAVIAPQVFGNDRDVFVIQKILDKMAVYGANAGKVAHCLSVDQDGRAAKYLGMESVFTRTLGKHVIDE